MNRATQPTNPTWSFILGSVSIVLTVEFWLHLLVPSLRRRIPFPFWPTGAFIDLSVSGLLAVLAAMRGSRFWWIAAVCAVGTLAFLFAGFRG